VDFASVKMKTRPKYKTGVILDFDINEVRSVEMTLVGDKGEHFKVDKLIRILNVEEEVFTGYDSKVYINDVKDIKMLEGGGCFEADRCCKFSVPLPTGINEMVIDLGEVICK
jgi:outer membrane usher protein FimD/PapC